MEMKIRFSTLLLATLPLVTRLSPGYPLFEKLQLFVKI